MKKSPPAARRWAIRVTFVLLGLAAAFGFAEIVCRRYKPSAGVQIVAARDGLEYWIADGVPLWRENTRTDQPNESCPQRHPGAIRIEIFGPSIFWGSGLSSNEPSFPALLQKKLDAAAPGSFCVLNFSQQGYHWSQDASLARDLIPRYRPALVFWSVWAADPFPFTVLGARAYDLSLLPVGADGYPRAVPVPALLNRVIFRNSRFYEYATLKLLRLMSPWPDTHPLWERAIEHDLRGTVRLSRRFGATLVPVFCPRLDRPFAEWGSAPDAESYVPDVEEAIRSERIPEIRLGDLLRGRDYRDLRLDSCCHFNEAGHEALADIFFQWIMAHPALLKR